MNTAYWFGCYDGSWQSAPLVPEAYAHPAKVSFGLAERIYHHMLIEGWLAPGEMVLDPFGGIGGFAFHAALYGMHWTGVELEQKFVDLGNQNLELWRNRYAPHFPNYGSAQLVQGDSRRLVEVVAGAGGVVSSPPYSQSEVASRAPAGADVDTRKLKRANDDWSGYGTTPGQLGNMPAGVVSSPPWERGTATQDPEFLTPGEQGKRNPSKSNLATYGTTPGQLGNMPAGVVSSPPFGDTNQSTDDSFLQRVAADRRNGSRAQPGLGTYGTTPGQLGNDSATTFWSAAAVIVQQCYDILRHGGYAAWVTGDFVRNKQRVPFGEQWLALCESVGFEPVLWAVAWKAQHNGTQHSIFGDAQELRKTKVSFFRRLANQKRPDTAIENEDVIFVRKPA